MLNFGGSKPIVKGAPRFIPVSLCLLLHKLILHFFLIETYFHLNGFYISKKVRQILLPHYILNYIAVV